MTVVQQRQCCNRLREPFMDGFKVEHCDRGPISSRGGTSDDSRQQIISHAPERVCLDGIRSDIRDFLLLASCEVLTTTRRGSAGLYLR